MTDRRLRGRERLQLAAHLAERPAYRLGDGRLTSDRAVAEADPLLRRKHAEAVNATLAELLRLPLQPPSGRPTPARRRLVHEMIDGGRLSPSIGHELLATGRIDDVAWALVARLSSLDHHKPALTECWNLTLWSSRTGEVALPIQYDMFEHRDHQPPTEAFIAASAALIRDGWSVDWIRAMTDDIGDCRGLFQLIGIEACLSRANGGVHAAA